MNRRLGGLLAALLGVCAAARGGEAPEQGLVGHWRFDRANGPVADLSGGGHTATVTGGEAVADGERTVLKMDGTTRIEVPSVPELNLRPGFSIEARFRPDSLATGQTIVAKAKQYLLRLDWPEEHSQLSFFVFLDGEWEPRVSAPTPEIGKWHHVVASWDGTRSVLWLDGQPYDKSRAGALPAATSEPVAIGSTMDFGGAFTGCLESVRLYSRPLSTAEVIRRAYGIEPGGARAAGVSPLFGEPGRGWSGWEGRDATAVSVADGQLVVRAATVGTLAMNRGLAGSVDPLGYLCLRMAVDRGSRACLVFATGRGAGRVPFQTYADGQPHTYVLEPWQWPGWGGDLLALGLVPAEVDGATARLSYLRVCAEPEGEPELQILSLVSERSLPRSGRPERVTARVRNTGGPAAAVRIALEPPAGVRLTAGTATQTVERLAYQAETELGWEVTAERPGAYAFRLAVKTAGATPVARAVEITFLPALAAAKADYVPEPVPATPGRYTVWTHYCPLWKHGTHLGWKAIEPWPERKPVLGWFDEGTPEVADWHIKYWLEHGISASIYCWYRSNLDGPVTQSLGHAIHDGLLKARYLSMIRFGIMWENGCGKGVGSKADLMDNVLPFWLDHYFTHPSYLKIDGKPVLYIWVPGNVTRDLGGSDAVRSTFAEMREACRRRGLAGLYLVGCCGAADRAMLERMAQEGWDASSAYGNGWAPPREVKTVGEFTGADCQGFVEQQERIWQGKREVHALPDITAAMMGWDSRPWNETPFFWSDNTPAKFRDLCLRARSAVDAQGGTGPAANTVIFCCWNEFGEGHYIEPTRGYGFSYVDTIRDVFTAATGPHTDLAPEDVGLGPYDSWYRAARQAAPGTGPSSQTSWSGDQLAAWTGMMNLAGTEVRDGVLRMVSTGSDPALSSPPLKVRAARLSKVTVDMRVSRAGGAQLFFATAADPHVGERASCHVTTVADGQFHPCVFEVGRNEHWGGCLTSLRLDPTNFTDVTVEIRRIALE